MLTCREVTKLVSESMDRRLPWRVRVGMRIHFMMCVSCTRYRRQLLLIRELIRDYLAPVRDSARDGGQLPLESRQRIKEALRDAESKEE